MYRLTHTLLEGVVARVVPLPFHLADTLLFSSHFVIFAEPQKLCLLHFYDEKTLKQPLRYQEY